MTSKRDFGETERPTRPRSGLFLPSEAAREGPMDPTQFTCILWTHGLRYLISPPY